MSADPKLLSLASWYRQPLHREWWLIALTPPLMLAITVLLLRSSAEDPEENLKVSRADVLKMQPQPIPAVENAALEYQKAFVLYVPFAGEWDYDPESLCDMTPGYFNRTDVQAWFKSNEPYFAQLEIALALKKCNWNLDYLQGFSLGLPHLGKMNEAARYLAARATQRAVNGDHIGAARDLAAIQTLAKHMESNRVLFCSLNQTACRATALETLQRIAIFNTPMRLEEIEAYRALCEIGPDPYIEMSTTIEHEMQLGLYELDRRANVGALMPFQVSNNYNLAYGSERSSYKDIFSRADACFRAGKLFDFSHAVSRLEGPVLQTKSIFSKINGVMAAQVVNAEQRRCAHAALSVLCFRAKHGRDPAVLSELVPEFLPEMPRGFFSPQELRLKIDPNEIKLLDRASVSKFKLPRGTLRIYAFGKNGQDDNGRNGNSIELIENSNADDSVFFVPPMKTEGAP